MTISKPRLFDGLAPSFAKYNEDQFVTVQLPGSATNSQPAIISVDSRVDTASTDRYYDPSSATSFAFDHRTQKASAAQSHAVEGDLAYVLLSSLRSFFNWLSSLRLLLTLYHSLC